MNGVVGGAGCTPRSSCATCGGAGETSGTGKGSIEGVAIGDCWAWGGAVRFVCVSEGAGAVWAILGRGCVGVNAAAADLASRN